MPNTNNSQVPKPPKEIDGGLRRDNKASIAETLARLKSSTSQSTNQVKTASALPSQAEKRSGDRRKLLIGAISVFIIFCLAAAISYRFSTQTNPLNTGNSSGLSDRITVVDTPQDLVSIMNNPNQLRGNFIIDPNREFENPDDLISSRAEYLSILGLDFDTPTVLSLQGWPNLMIDETTTPAQFVISLRSRDLPATTQSLREWENTATNSRMIINNSFNSTQDVVFEGQNYRVINDSLAYLISDSGEVFIGTSPATIAQSNR